MAAPPRPNQIPHDRLSNGHDTAEYFELDDDPDAIEIVETESAFADKPGQRVESTPPDDGFYRNLAASLGDQAKDRITTDLIRLIEMDKEARGKRDEQYAEGIKRTGMGKDAPGGAEFEGASRVVHPMMTEACIDYQSRIMKEVMPPTGPVKPGIIGAATKSKLEKADRVSQHMNYQITHEIRGARTTMEVLFAQVPLGGSQFIRQYWDHRLKRPCWQFAPVDKVLVPFGAADFASAKRKTFIDLVDSVEFRKRVNQKMYLDLDLAAPAQAIADTTKSEEASHKVEGAEDPGSNEDGDRELYETMCYLDVDDDMERAFRGEEKSGDMCPYLVTIDVNGAEMLSMYRTWEAGDPACEPIEHLFEFGFVPWRGAYSIGFPQIIGGLSAAATGALRALLDSATVNTIPSGLILKGSGLGGQSRTPDPGVLVELDGGLETDDIRKKVMAFPFNQPSPVLFQLLGFLVESSRGIIRTSMDETPSDTVGATPVGTQISRVEEGMKVFSAVHGRAHAAMNRLLHGLHRLNRLYLADEVKVDAAGIEILVSREDYEGPCDIAPTSDPNIYSDLQRFNQLNYIQQRQVAVPGLYKPYQVELAGLKLIRWPDPESLLNIVPEPSEQNAVNENLCAVLSQPIAVYPGQDHLAHIQVHLDFMGNPTLGMNPIMTPTFMPPMLKHCMEHIAYFYTTQMQETIEAATGRPHTMLASDEPEVKVAFDKLLATASVTAKPEITNALQGVIPVLAQAMQAFKASQPPPPMDPATAAVEAAKAETARKSEHDKATVGLNTEKLHSEIALETQKVQQEAELAAQKTEMARVEMAAKQNEMERNIQITQAELANQSADRAIQIEKISKDFEAAVLKVLADYETKTAATQQQAEATKQQAISDFHTQVGTKIESLGESFNELVKTIDENKPLPTNIPSDALQHLAEGQVTTFGNGSRWTMKKGKATRVKPA